jgi:hypothetical protein
MDNETRWGRDRKNIREEKESDKGKKAIKERTLRSIKIWKKSLPIKFQWAFTLGAIQNQLPPLIQFYENVITTGKFIPVIFSCNLAEQHENPTLRSS